MAGNLTLLNNTTGGNLILRNDANTTTTLINNSDTNWLFSNSTTELMSIDGTTGSILLPVE